MKQKRKTKHIPEYMHKSNILLRYYFNLAGGKIEDDDANWVNHLEKDKTKSYSLYDTLEYIPNKLKNYMYQREWK